MSELEIPSLEALAELAGSDKGNISRVFHQKQRPRVDALEPLAQALQISVYELLVRIGAIDPKADEPPVVTKKDSKVTFTWPKA